MHRFRIDATLDPQSLPRIAGFFAQRAMVPTTLRMRRLRQHMRVDVAVAGLTAAQATVIAAKLGEMFVVIAVELVARHRVGHPGEGRDLAAAA